MLITQRMRETSTRFFFGGRAFYGSSKELQPLTNEAPQNTTTRNRISSISENSLTLFQDSGISFNDDDSDSDSRGGISVSLDSIDLLEAPFGQSSHDPP
jgi:hypothetical protein